MIRRKSIAALAALSSLLLLRPLAASPSGLLNALAGFSGKLRAVFVLPGEGASLALGRAADKPGNPDLSPGVADAFPLILMKPFSAKVGGRIGPYRLGTWPYEGRSPADPVYASPDGFIEVTPENLRTRVSEHFTLGEFLTKDQQAIWPKYLVLERRLLDKLELTIAELSSKGHSVGDLFIMSGFRTPLYNGRGVGAGGRSSVSRHQYGDAADVYPDDDGTGQMDDLNRDGRVDLADARILAEAAEAVERRHPELVGGIGIYQATDAHGPFVHIDVRGKRARWVG